MDHVVLNYRSPSYKSSETVTFRKFLVDFCITKDGMINGDFIFPSLRKKEMDELSDGYVASLGQCFVKVFLESRLTRLSVNTLTYGQEIYCL